MSSAPQIGIMLPRDMDPRRVLEFARHVEKLGFDELWVVEDLAAAIARADELDPYACRERVATHFDLPVMGAGYERVYQRVLDRSRRTRRAAQAVA